MTGRTRTASAALLTALLTALLALGAVPAGAQADQLDVRIRGTELAADGATRVVVSISGAAAEDVLRPGTLRVVDGGLDVHGVGVTPLLEDAATSLAVLLAIDVSGSTEGEPIAAAKAAAADFAREVVAAGGLVGVVSFRGVAELIVPLTDDVDVLRSGIAGLEARGETALYDAIVLATETLRTHDGIRNLIVFSDGADTVSRATLDGAVEAAAASEVPVTTVALATDALDTTAITDIASGTGGHVIEAADSASLAGAFDTAAAEVTNQYVLAYTAVPAESPDLDLAVVATIAGETARDAVTVTNPRQVVSSGPAPATIARPLAPGDPWVLWAGIAAAFAALALLFGVGTVAARSGGEGRRLQRSLRIHTGGAVRERARDLDAAALSRRAGALVERLPMPGGFDTRLQKRLDQAAWPLRASEFLALLVGVAVGAGILGWALTGNPVLALVGLVVGGFAPRVVLDRKVASRASAFLEQLPDTLGLLAGSLKAGYGLVQAIDTVVREAASPTSEEFARALTETRLGMPLGEALEGMAERLESEDFSWVVMAINIQAEVGGNLAQLLDTVADTLRGREQVRRQVKTLAAEGKLSAYVLLGLVPAMALYMSVVNASYMSLLWTTPMGRAMLAVGALLMTGGVIGIKKTISIDV